MTGLDHQAFAAWVEALGRSWETGDAEAAGQLFAEDIAYREDRFSEPMRGRQAVIQYWEDVPRTQQNIRFGYRVIAVAAATGIAHWWCSFERIPSGVPVRLDGVFLATFDAQGQCSNFEEWWHIEEPALV
jgi:ketosteroid isomerase-like protein